MHIRITFILILLPSYLSLFSQTYPIPAKGAEWNNTVIDISSTMNNQTTTRIEVNGDTLIGSVLYSKVFATWVVGYYQTGNCEFSSTGIGGTQINRYEGAIRTNDNGVVKFVWENDTMVRTIYDFSLVEGDSIQIDGMNGEYYAYVQKVDTILIIDQPRKRITLQGINAFHDEWIEGIGSLYGLFATFDRHWEFVDYELTCYEENDVTIYAANLECTRCDVVTKNMVHTQDELITVYPMPISSRAVIEWSNSLYPEKLNVYDLLGRKLFSKSINETNSVFIDRAELEEGVLILEIIETNGNTYNQQIIVK